MSKNKEMTYDDALTELQGIVSQLQEDVVNIDELSEKAKRAAVLVKFCQERLRSIEEEVGGLFEEK